MTYRLAGVWAHPDDETYSTAGSLILHEGEVDYTLIVVTSGEAGPIADPTMASRENLAEVREREQRDALAEAGVADAPVHFLRYPDGGVADVPRRELVTKVADILREARPQAVVTFDAQGITGHADHIAVHHATTEAFHVLRDGSDDPSSFARLFYACLPASKVDVYFAEARRMGLDIGEPGDPFLPRGVPDESIAVRVDARRVFRRKLRALGAHATQRDEVAAIPERFQEEAIGVEHFQLGWPARGADDTVLTDLFEGLAVG